MTLAMLASSALLTAHLFGVARMPSQVGRNTASMIRFRPGPCDAYFFDFIQRLTQSGVHHMQGTPSI
jgi:hypothetical protein